MWVKNQSVTLSLLSNSASFEVIAELVSSSRRCQSLSPPRTFHMLSFAWNALSPTVHILYASAYKSFQQRSLP